jgi:nucleoside triphosphate pyrophosphatase
MVKQGIVARGEAGTDFSTGDAPIILASGSPTRARMLSRAGIRCDIIPAAIDEDAEKTRSHRRQTKTDTAGIALRLARQKARHVSAMFPGRWVIGADQILDLAGEIVDKPTDRAQADRQLSSLSGRSHALISAVSVMRDEQELWHHVDRARLRMRVLSARFLDAYLDQLGDAAFSSPGAYQVEGLGVLLFDRIDGNHYTILGMPLLPLLDFLRSRNMVLA